MTDFQQLFPNNRQEGDTDLRKAQLVMLRILKIVDYICQKNKIQYWLDGGTLLGAVRHEGFIPWDDDLDIVMPRADFNRFLNVAPKELQEDLFLQTHKTESGYIFHGNPPLKIIDKYSRITLMNVNSNVYDQGLFIDIIPIDKFSKAKPEHYIDYFLKRIYRYLCGHYNPYDYKKEKKSFLQELLSKLVKSLPLEKLLGSFAKILDRRTKHNNKTDRNYWIGYCLEVPWIRLWEIDEIFPLQPIKFEDAYFPAPHDWDSILKKFYGDYRTLPDEDKRASPHMAEIVIDIKADK